MIIKVQAESLNFEPKLLIKQHGRVVHRYVQSDILSLTRLNQVIKHYFCYATSSKIRMHKKEWNVSFTDLYIWGHKCATNQQFTIQHYYAKIWVLQILTHVHWPKEVGYEIIHGRKEMFPKVAKIYTSFMYCRINSISPCTDFLEKFYLQWNKFRTPKYERFE